MTPERHAQVKEVFIRACELEGDDLDRFLGEACRDDSQLLAEVNSLLAHHSPQTLLGGLSATRVDPHARTAEPAASWGGRLLGKYEVSRVLDSGGMGVVLEARDTDLGRHVAIKVLHHNLVDDGPMRERFFAEARAAAGLHHPNVITVHDVAVDGGEAYLVMEYAEGGSTADRLKEKGPYPLEEATRIAADACRGLSAAHAQGLVHRDIKPANLLLTEAGVVKVSDFGAAKQLNRSSLQLTRTGQLVGTPDFMSPEQCEGAAVDPRTDIYSLGATYYCLLVGAAPYNDCGSLVSVINAHCNAEPPDPCEAVAGLPTRCRDIVFRAMAKSPADRFPSCDAMLDALEGRTDPIVVASPRPVESRTTRRALITGAALLAVAAAGWWVGRWPEQTASSRGASGAIGPTDSSAPAFAEEPIRIGLLHSLSGTMAHSEKVIVDGYLLAIEELNAGGGVLGRRVEPIVVDGRSTEEGFSEGAERLIGEEKVCTIFGCCTSSSRKSVAEVVEREDHLLVYSVNHEGVETSPNIVYLGGDPTQTVIPCARWAYSFGQMRTFFLVGSDYVYPRMANEILKDELASMGARVVGEEYLSLGSANVQGVVDKIAAAKPDIIINTISGDTQTAFVRALYQSDVGSAHITTGVGEEDLRSPSLDHLVGAYAVSTYFQSIDRPENLEFVAAFKKKFGNRRVVAAPMETAYDAIKLWAGAVEQAARTDPLVIRDAMLDQSYDAPSGLIRLDPKSQYAYRYAMIGRVSPAGQYEIVWRSAAPIAPQPYPESRSPEAWEKEIDQLRKGWGGRWSAP
ncbi:Serine/threonine-protein kinase PrkC [Pseudobythopirellula maris]|uniref:non-specific serine/threonine protein kinase n=1 Tax=Pseudobythopirellula maris TaxID=2527991 RepID=A0A5C5ZTK2_9BACT|nr:transporter substrate-binding protein [Pseudobythopirellula maris]TWT90405.1 Serine/threonine-protein kinase PrkC [Pseudobythopirellula maris]